MFPTRVLPPCALRRAVTLVEMIVVLAIIAALTGVSISMFVISNRQSAIASDATKIEKAMATARSDAIRSGTRCFQVTIWADEKQFWIDGIDASDPNDRQTSPNVAQAQIVSPESLQAAVQFDKFEGGVPYTVSANGKTYQLRAYRFFPDGTSDDGAVYLRHDDASAGSQPVYYRIRLYGPTARPAIFPKVAAPA
jgi:prepilin-type N-terminal cleavage/methylation domain-containing protein